MQKVYQFNCVVDRKNYSISLDQQQIAKMIEDNLKALLSREMLSKYQIAFNGEWVLREKNIFG